MTPPDRTHLELYVPDDDPQPQPGAAGCYADSCQLGALWLLTVTVTAALLGVVVMYWRTNRVH